MHALGRLLIATAKILSMFIGAYKIIILGAVIVSWVGADPYNPIVRLLRQMTEPVFRPVRRILPAFLFKTGFDFTPLVVLALLFILEDVGVGQLYEFAQTLLSK